jgi:hypothetical protein
VISKSAAVVALLLVLAAGCGGSGGGVPVDSPSSPLGTGGDQVKQCGPDPSAAIMTFGSTVLENHSKGTVIIEQVSFYGDHHLRLVHAVILPIGNGLIGVAYGWPPPRKNIIQTSLPWDKRVSAIGARLPPDPAHSDDRNLVIGMQPTAHKGIAAGVQVRYRENGQQYELRTHTENVVIIAKSAGKC